MSDNSNLRYSRENISLRRGRVLELVAQGLNTVQIAERLNVSRPLISLDLQYLRSEANNNIKEYIDHTIPFTFNQTVKGLDMIIREGWSMSDSTKDVKERLAALSLVMEAYDKRINLLTNSQIVNKAAERVLNMKKEIEDIQMREEGDNNKEEDNNNIHSIYPYHESTVVEGETVKQKVMRINGYTTEEQYQQAKKDDIICNYTEEQENELVENLPHRDIDSDSNWLNSKHPQSQRKF